MRSLVRSSLALAVLATLSGFGVGTACAGVDTNSGLPPKPEGFSAPAQTHAPGKSSSTSANPEAAASTNPGVVPAISGHPGSGPQMPTSVKETSAEQWAKLIQAPNTGTESFLTRQQAEQAIVMAAQAHRLTSLPPIAGTNGEILYPYGQSWPTVVGSPLHVTIVQLMPGSKPFSVAVGSPGLWDLQQSMAGNVPEVLIKPVYAGLHTNLVITAKGPQGQALTYNLTLVSDKSRFVPMVGFYYPDEMLSQWHVQAQDQAAQKQRAEDQTVAVLPNLNVADLDFHWKVHCAGGGWFSSSDCHSIEPERVFDDGVHTYIQMPAGLGNHGGLPSILARNVDGKPAIINWRFRDGYFVVDGVPDQIDLIAGAGDSAKVVRIVHEGH
jgi:type IV secretion system protein VirB9